MNKFLPNLIIIIFKAWVTVKNRAQQINDTHILFRCSFTMIYTVNHVTYLNDNVTVKGRDHFLRSVARSRYESTISYYSSKINNALMQEIQTNRSYIHKEK